MSRTLEFQSLRQRVRDYAGLTTTVAREVAVAAPPIPLSPDTPENILRIEFGLDVDDSARPKCPNRSGAIFHMHATLSSLSSPPRDNYRPLSGVDVALDRFLERFPDFAHVLRPLLKSRVALIYGWVERPPRHIQAHLRIEQLADELSTPWTHESISIFIYPAHDLDVAPRHTIEYVGCTAGPSSHLSLGNSLPSAFTTERQRYHPPPHNRLPHSINATATDAARSIPNDEGRCVVPHLRVLGILG